MCFLSVINEKNYLSVSVSCLLSFFLVVNHAFFMNSTSEFAFHLVIIMFLVISYCFDFQFLNLVLKGE